jgi:outer membrane lipoprotein-sorting protein
MKLAKPSLLLVVLTLNLAQAQTLHNGEDLLRAMHDRYKDSWYKTVTFTQKSTTYKPDGTSSVETWYEAALLPGKLRIDIGPASDGKGYVFSDGNVTVIKDNKVVANVKDINMLLVLGFDVYRQDPEATINVVKGEGYDLSKLREDSWEGKPAYVVGAEKGDLKSKQFWVAKDNLLFLREIESARDDASKLEDIRFIHYQPLAGAWIAAGVEVYSNGARKSSPRTIPISKPTRNWNQPSSIPKSSVQHTGRSSRHPVAATQATPAQPLIVLVAPPLPFGGRIPA